MNVLFVCTGNTCRSPMAAGLFGFINSNSICQSAGLHAVDGQCASGYAVTAAASLGADICAHRSRKLTPEIAESADLLVALGWHHKEILQSHYPRKRVVLLGNGIDDPYGCDLEAYKECALQIFDALHDLCE